MRRTTWMLGAWMLACGATSGDDEGAADSTSVDTTASATAPTDASVGDDAPTDASVGDDAPEPTSGTDPTVTDDGVPESSGPADSSGGTTGATPGDCSAALLCDDFEDDPLGDAPAAPWVVSTQESTLAVDGAMAFSGAQSIHITTNDGAGTYRRAYMSIEGAPVFPIEGNVVWGRMMIHLVATPEGSVHWTNIQGEGDVPGMDFRGLYRYGGQHDGRLMANYETQGTGSDCWDHSDTVMPTGVWTCFEWHFDGTTDTMQFFLDGVELADMTVMGMGEGCIAHDTGDYWYAPVFDTMRLGWEHYQATSSREMWIDDVALDDARIGCPM
jgi:hypothetical protein